MGDGKYCHFGLVVGLQYELKGRRDLTDEIHVNVNVDGLPLTKSTKHQFWPILCHVKNYKCNPFPIGVFYGTSKNISANTFLEHFVSEMIEVLINGVLIDGRIIQAKLAGLICDAPAKAYVFGVKGHNAYYGCTKCTTEGTYQNGRVCYPELDAALMTDEGFRNQLHEDHHINETILKDLPIDLVKIVPEEYMHLVLLGVVHKLLVLWFKGDKAYRLGSSVRDQISVECLKVEPHIREG
ncbi:uncharacterized protein LOC135395818 [Ornithodoros turicata]|uniref:uncharacterized protein LOC135395818 n=1 Tax=Ornithodoros turicata TaxID=34597 RepID=UPI003138EB6E